MTPDELQDPYLRKALPPESNDPMVYCMILLGSAAVTTWSVVYLVVDDINRYFPYGDAEYKLAVAYKLSNFLMGIVIVFWGPQFSYRSRVVPAFAMQGLCIIALAVLTQRESLGPRMLMTLMAMAGSAQALSHGTLTALCSVCPERYMRNFVVGLGMSALIVSFLKLICKILFINPLTCQRIWLGSLFVVFIFAIIGYLRIVDTDITFRVCTDLARDDGERQPIVVSSRQTSRHWGLVIPMADYKRVFWQIAHVLAIMILNWTISFCVFPGMAADLDSSSAQFQKSGWYHVLLMITFVIADTLGRMIMSFAICLRDLSTVGLLILTIARGLFIPTFLLINKFDGHHQAMDVCAFFFMALLGISNGYAVQLCSVKPTRLVDSSEREIAGSLSFLSYICGQSCGVVAALVMKESGIVPEL
eukprot:gnl/MRDRNA2_/MRDRNA2_35152_c0_seq1.p1 gnl/MRDRNA2_/MRDRNA2_35152_c0~~gnl/MRDRNA2_/MRDRNA2_35152_c0_seq1.p1  ORF type:complete len:460 (+),score=41.12 gnl/MRDRNA2_/MRDRNA2_35152_c0_seq1:129-1382(+)